MTRDEFYREANPDSRGPLAGYRVLEVTQAIAGPVVGTVFADLGAEVLRCELPGQGDMTRWIDPFLDAGRDPNAACWHMSVNRGKRAVTLDIRTPEGQAIFRDLARDADVLVENFTPGSMDELGLGYAAIRQVNPAIVYVSVSGFGQWGPLSGMRGVDTVAQAVSGMMAMNGVVGGDPLISTANLVDHLTGWQGAIGAMAALLHRHKTGEGQYIDVALADTAIYASDQRIMAAHNADKQWPRMGNSIDMGAPMNCYRCRDGGYVYLFAILDTLWPRVCTVIGREDLIDDPRCKGMRDRAQNRQFVDQVTADWIGAPRPRRGRAPAAGRRRQHRSGAEPRRSGAVPTVSGARGSDRHAPPALRHAAHLRRGAQVLQNPGPGTWPGAGHGPAQRRGLRPGTGHGRRAHRRAEGQRHHLTRERT